MNSPNIHPQIKEALKSDVNRKAPASLHKNIMQQVMHIHAAKFYVPTNNGIAIFGLMACGLLIMLSMYLQQQDIAQLGLDWQLPALNIPTWLWFSICAGLSLFAADSLITQRAKHRLQTKKHQ